MKLVIGILLAVFCLILVHLFFKIKNLLYFYNMRVVIVILSFVAMIILVVMLVRMKQQSHYKYTIQYNHAKYSCEDYTNEFEYLPGGSTIRYINENGDSIYRTGTFSIEKN
jgi:hypothetical protein